MFRQKALAIVLAGLAAFLVVGCGAGNQAVVEPDQKQVDTLKTLRGYFDGVHGDYSQLTADQKKAFLDYSGGDQQKVDSLWAFMTNPRGGGVVKPNASGPGFSMGGPGGVRPAGG